MPNLRIPRFIDELPLPRLEALSEDLLEFRAVADLEAWLQRRD